MIKNYITNVGITVHKAILVVKLTFKQQASITVEKKFMKDMENLDPKSKEYKKLANQLKHVRSIKKSLTTMIDAL